VSHRTSGLDALRRRLAALPDAARMAAAPALQDVAERVADEVRAALDGEARVGPSAPGTRRPMFRAEEAWVPGLRSRFGKSPQGGSRDRWP